MLRITALPAAMIGALLCLTGNLAGAASSPTFPDAAASDPATLKWMVGAPPPPDRTLRFEDGSYFRFPARISSEAATNRRLPRQVMGS